MTISHEVIIIGIIETIVIIDVEILWSDSIHQRNRVAFRIHSIQLMIDTETDRSKGYGFITYSEAEDAKKAMEHLNGFELAGRAMKVGHVTEQAPVGPALLDQDDENCDQDHAHSHDDAITPTPTQLAASALTLAPP